MMSRAIAAVEKRGAEPPAVVELVDDRVGDHLDRAVDQDLVDRARPCASRLRAALDDRDAERRGRGRRELASFRARPPRAPSRQHRGRITGSGADHERALAGSGAIWVSSWPSTAGGGRKRPSPSATARSP